MATGKTQRDPFGENLKETRKARKLSVPRVAAVLNIPKDRIYKWEQGTSTPKFADRKKVEEWIASADWKNIPREEEDEIAIAYSKKAMTKDLLQVMAWAKTFRARLAKVEARVFLQDEGDVLDSIDADTRINIKDLMNELKQ